MHHSIYNINITNQFTSLVFLYPLKTYIRKPEVSDVFKGCRKRPVVWNGVKYIQNIIWRKKVIQNDYKHGIYASLVFLLTLQVPTPQNDQAHSNNSSTTANEIFECVWPFCGVGA